MLTKNPPRLIGQAFPTNAWVGATVDTQSRADAFAEVASHLEASVVWLSCEPLLEPLHFEAAALARVAWVVIGAQTRARTAASQPEWDWVAALIEQAQAAGAALYAKDNLALPDGVARFREYPDVLL